MVKPIRTYLIWLVGAASSLALAAPLAAGQADFGSCPLVELRQHPVHKVLQPNSSSQRDLVRFRASLCAFIEDGRTDWTAADVAAFQKPSARYRLADQVWISRLSYHYYCRPGFKNELDKASTPEPFRNVVRKYCRDYAKTLLVANLDAPDPSEDIESGRLPALETLLAYQERRDWFLKEMFCQISAYMANPGGWSGAIEPDLPAMQRLKEEADSLCDEVRKDLITADEASYRWGQEWQRFKRRLGPEAAGDTVSEAMDHLTDILKSLVN